METKHQFPKTQMSQKIEMETMKQTFIYCSGQCRFLDGYTNVRFCSRLGQVKGQT